MLDDVRAAFDRSGERLGPFAGRLVLCKSVASTQDEAARLAADGAPEGSLVVADTQTRGRGRSGRIWVSPPGAGLYVSVVLRPQSWSAVTRSGGWRTSLITLAAGVALAEGIRASTGLPVEIKWPNDIVIRGGLVMRAAPTPWRKVAGILTEASATGAHVQHVIVGMGVNVGHAVYPADLSGGATSLEAEAGRPVDRGTVLVETLAALWTRYTAIAGGREAQVLNRWRELSPAACGSLVAWERDGEMLRGVTAGIGDDGALLVKVPGGKVESVVSGEVRWV